MARLTWGTRAGRVVLTSCGALAALALIAGGFYWWGGPHERRVARQVLAGACDGVLPSAELLDFLGEGPLRSGPGRTDLREAHGDRRQVTCAVSRATEHHAGHPTHDASVEVTVQGVPERRGGSAEDGAGEVAQGHGPLYPDVPAELPPAALGRGWQGLFTTGESFTHRADGESVTTTVLLDCARDRGGLLVTVEVEEEDGTLDDPRRRTAYARIATATAAKASRQWGCDAPLGKPLRTVALPVNADEDVPLADASGSCRGVPGRGARVSRAWEGRPVGGPLEVCVVAGGRTGMPAGAPESEARGHRLVAYYGPYAQAERLRQRERHGGYSEKPVPGEAPAGRLPGGGHWATATCRDGSGPALFTVRLSGTTDGEAYGTDESVGEHRAPKPTAADLAYERTALREFARRSTKAHDCAAPTLP
ncbi:MULTISPECIES: hypothetical protein [Streptomyces]|uniref:hypothetical protein n=1 Tax=Streptomyces TaxID=1883 RepID=UPI001E3AEDF2|nr:MULTISPECIES: hypothetical protein [Streptomyces]UFQ18842.1 hypothetical protein J2N69_29820 [Streptomyces huasconensis]WCL88459.1 hypothetical protein PPN52_29785 [Streptomyces sp. JCM 35825]